MCRYYTYVHAMPMEPEERVRSPGTGFAAGCELPRGRQEPTRSSEEQPVPLTSEPSPAPWNNLIFQNISC